MCAQRWDEKKDLEDKKPSSTNTNSVDSDELPPVTNNPRLERGGGIFQRRDNDNDEPPQGTGGPPQRP